MSPRQEAVPAPDSRDRRIAFLVALLAFLLYNANLRDISTGDSFPARFVPMAVLHNGSVYLDDLAEAARMGHQDAYWILPVQGRLASMYPLVTPLLATPLYLPAILYLDHHGWEDVERVQQVGQVMEKLAASWIAAACAGLMFWLLRRRMSRARSLLLTTAFALGTETWVISSQALWQHGTAELLILVALLAATGPPTTGNLAMAGAACGLLIANRPPDAVLAAAFAAYAPFWARPRPKSVVFFAAAAAPLAIMVGYNLVTFGNLSGGYGYILRNGAGYDSFFRFPLWSGLAGELISPGKGLFVYCPFLLFLPALFNRSLVPGRRLLTAFLVAGVAVQLVLYAKTDWRGGFSYGPRYLTDLVPILIWMLAPVVASLHRAGLSAFVAAALFSVYVQGIGAFFYPGAGSDQLYYQGGFAADDLTNVWKPECAAFVVELRASPRQHFEFLRLER